MYKEWLNIRSRIWRHKCTYTRTVIQMDSSGNILWGNDETLNDTLLWATLFIPCVSCAVFGSVWVFINVSQQGCETEANHCLTSVNPAASSSSSPHWISRSPSLSFFQFLLSHPPQSPYRDLQTQSTCHFADLAVYFWSAMRTEF